jgi:hypothetical protein
MTDVDVVGESLRKKLDLLQDAVATLVAAWEADAGYDVVGKFDREACRWFKCAIDVFIELREDLALANHDEAKSLTALYGIAIEAFYARVRNAEVVEEGGSAALQ